MKKFMKLYLIKVIINFDMGLNAYVIQNFKYNLIIEVVRHRSFPSPRSVLKRLYEFKDRLNLERVK